MTLGTCCYLIRRYGLRDAWRAWRCGRAWRKAARRRELQMKSAMVDYRAGRWQDAGEIVEELKQQQQKVAMWEIMRR